MHLSLFNDFTYAVLTQRGDPVKSCGFDLFPDARFGQQAAVAHQYDPLQPELLLNFADLARQRAGIGGIAFKDLHPHGAAVHVAEQAEDDLRFAFLAVSGVAMLGQIHGFPLNVGAGHVTQKQ